MNLITTIQGHRVRKSSASGAGNDCLYLTPAKARRTAVADSKAGLALSAPIADLLLWAKLHG